MSGKMNPNASQFSPSAVAMVQHNGAVKDSDFENSPRDMIVHQALKDIIQEVHDLKLRSTDLEEENGNLKRENKEFKCELSSLKKTLAHGTAAPAVVPTLTGHAASETSSKDLHANGACHAEVTSSGNDTASLKKRVEEHQNTVEAILKKFNEYLTAETSKREELASQVNRFQFVLRELKGRVGVLEPKFKAMLSDMDKVEADVEEIRNDNSFMSVTTQNANGPSSFFQDQIEKLGRNVEAIKKKLKGLEGDVDMHRVVINELNQNANNDGLTSVQQWGVSSVVEDGGSGKASSRSDVFDAVDLCRRVNQMGREVQTLQQMLDKSIYEKRAIDNCPTRERLYEYYQSYSKDIEQAASNGYQEYQDNLWALRDRVIIRLTLFDGYGKAVQEAKTADIGL